jgi:hypothetical protein
MPSVAPPVLATRDLDAGTRWLEGRAQAQAAAVGSPEDEADERRTQP